MGPTGCPTTSVTHYQSTLPNIPEDLRSHLHRSESLKSHIETLALASFRVTCCLVYINANVTVHLTSRGPCIVIYSYNKSQRDALLLKLFFDIELYMFRTDLLSIIRSLNTVYAAIGVCHASYVDCLLVRSGPR